MERWAKVNWLGLDVDLEVSSTGRVRRASMWYEFTSHKGNACRSRKRERIYAHWIAKNGYPTISIKCGAKRRKYLVHRLVAQAFVPGYSPELSVNHINGNKQDNRVENLEWVTLGTNTSLQWRDGLVDLRGEKHPNSKLTNADVRKIRELTASGVSNAAVGRMFNITDGMVCMIKKRRRWASV